MKHTARHTLGGTPTKSKTRNAITASSTTNPSNRQEPACAARGTPGAGPRGDMLRCHWGRWEGSGYWRQREGGTVGEKYRAHYSLHCWSLHRRHGVNGREQRGTDATARAGGSQIGDSKTSILPPPRTPVTVTPPLDKIYVRALTHITLQFLAVPLASWRMGNGNTRPAKALTG